MRKAHILYISTIVVLLGVIFTMAFAIGAGAFTPKELQKFDIDEDGDVNVADVSMLLDFIGGSYKLPLKNGLYSEDGGVRMYLDDAYLTGFQTYNNKTLYFDPDTGLMVTENRTIDGVLYIFESFTSGEFTLYKARAAKQGFYEENGGLRYYIDDVRVTRWFNLDGNNLYFYASTGLMFTNRTGTIGGKLYGFEPFEYNGLTLYRGHPAREGLLEEDGGVRYYVGDIMQTGFVTIDNQKVYFDPETGLMQTGILVVDGWLYDEPTPFMYNGLTLYAYGEPVPSIELEFTLNDAGTAYTVTGIGTCTQTNVLIPDTYLDKPVTAIGDRAFSGQTQITAISIPNTVTSIGTRSFYNTGITEITIPESVTSIGTQIVYKANNLKTVYYNSTYCPSDNTSNQFLNNASIEKIVFGGSYIPSYSPERMGFANTVKMIEIANGMTSISSYAFCNCISLTSVTIGNGVISIDGNAFYGCTSLTSVTIPNNVTSIGSRAFYGCTSLTSVTIPNSVTTIGRNPFFNCTNLTVFYTGSLEQWISISFTNYDSNPCWRGADLFVGGELLTNAVIPDTISAVGYAFSGCTSLTSVTIPDSVISINDYAFYGCSNLISVTIPDSVIVMGNNAFSIQYIQVVYYDGTYEQFISITNNALIYAERVYVKGQLLTERPFEIEPNYGGIENWGNPCRTQFVIGISAISGDSSELRKSIQNMLKNGDAKLAVSIKDENNGKIYYIPEYFFDLEGEFYNVGEFIRIVTTAYDIYPENGHVYTIALKIYDAVNGDVLFVAKSEIGAFDTDNLKGEDAIHWDDVPHSHEEPIEDPIIIN